LVVVLVKGVVMKTGTVRVVRVIMTVATMRLMLQIRMVRFAVNLH